MGLAKKAEEMTFTICVIIVAAAAIIGIASNKLAHMGQDNPVEEVAEEVIKKQTGLDIDLSPESKEDPKAFP